MALTYFSICSANYLPLVRTLHSSLSRAEPDARFVLFLADEVPDHLSTDSLPFEVVEAKQLGIGSFADMAFRYDIMEFNTAIKPFCFLHLMDRDPGGEVVYLDPDIYVTAPLDELPQAFSEGAELILTPHALAPLDDGYDPDDRRIMQTGAYNLGFAAMADSGDTRRLLHWWADHMRIRCLNNLPGGIFVDQKFMDFAPAFVERTHILRHRGYNVAYWNLHERPVRLEGERWTAGGAPLVFFHFSGVDRRDPEVFSRHQNRFSASSAGQARQLLERYKQELAAHDDDRWKSVAYAYGRFENGEEIPDLMRRAYRRVYRDPREGSRADIFTLDPDFYHTPSEALADHSGAPVSRLMHELWRMRQDLRSAFNLGRAADRRAYAGWFAGHAGEQAGLPPSLVGAAPEKGAETPAAKDWHVDPNLPDAITVAGYLAAESGVGEAARSKAGAMRDAGLSVSTFPVRAGGFNNVLQAELTGNCDGRVLYLHVNADETIRVLKELPGSVKEGRYRIGYWAWELPAFPKHWLEAADELDEVWVPSVFVRDAVRQGTDKPVRLVPHAIVLRPGSRERGRALIGAKPDCLVVLHAFDTRSYLKRKNPVGALRAFKRAFPQPDPAQALLVLKSHGPLDSPAAQALFAEAAEREDVVVLHEAMSPEGVADLQEAADIFLSLHRAEGFGLNIAEMMGRGKLAIATGWSGNADFMTKDNAVPVPYQLQPLAPGDYPFSDGQHWAEPDLDAAAAALRQAAEEPAWREELGMAAASLIGSEFSLDTIGKLCRRHLENIFDDTRG
jgi:glycosyltransferase involved in cell wall biosynthesis